MPHHPTAYRDPKLPSDRVLPGDESWTEMLKAFDAPAANALIAFARTICPHDGLGDGPYRRTVAKLDDVAQANPEKAALLAELVQRIDGAMPLPFVELSEAFRVEILKDIEGSAAFSMAQRTVVLFLYDDLEVWQAFGYEGASVQHGGFVNRGFNDLDWLPEPPEGV
ncbi:hypothetical protein KUV62_13475 [Salipiger bermudensis]|uniref:hypothetical protein n=1 Tax=Salipiger bermudensis TaxID=344736 RepID=UPI001C997ECB|nr:hypothetical protein [Salipiger bermudensis]MBY6004925.1 hypothetical protein [Salipiger bermudensis]